MQRVQRVKCDFSKSPYTRARETFVQNAKQTLQTLHPRGVDLISDAPPFGRLWYGEPNAVSNAIDYAKFYSRSHNAVIRVYDGAGNVIQTHEHAGEFKD
jgi:hypothetical protein